MLTEKEVWEAIESLREDCFLRQYVNWASTQVSSHNSFHLAYGLILEAAAAPVQLVASGFIAKTYPNFWSLIVGSSGSQKTIAMNVARDLLFEISPEIIGQDPASEEAFFKMLNKRSKLLLMYPEFASVLANTRGGDNYRAKIRDAWTSIFDATPFSREGVRTSAVKIREPRFSLTGACTAEKLESHVEVDDWTGGFMSRFFLVYGEQERDLDYGIPNEPLRAWLKSRLSEMEQACANAANIEKCRGLTDEAMTLFTPWRRAVNTEAKTVKDERLAGPLRRVPLMAAKIAVLLTWDYGRAREGQPWVIEADVMQAGMRLAELHKKCAMGLGKRIAPNEEMRLQRLVWNAVGDDWTALGQVVKDADMTVKTMKPFIETLKLMSAVETHVNNTDEFIRRKAGGKPPQWNEGLSTLPPPPLPDNRVDVDFAKKTRSEEPVPPLPGAKPAVSEPRQEHRFTYEWDNYDPGPHRPPPED